MAEFELNKNLYFQKNYLNKDRWVGYFWQTKLIQKYFSTQDKVLEIGVGTGMVANFLKQNYNLITLDINSNLKPDLVASVEDLSAIGNNEHDGVLCAEVLEHLPFEKFEQSLNELKRVAKKYLIISLPYWGYTFGLKIKLPILGVKILKFKITGIKKHNFEKSTAGHYWEIGKKGYALKKIKNIFRKNNFKIMESFWDLDDPYHYYFVLEK